MRPASGRRAPPPPTPALRQTARRQSPPKGTPTATNSPLPCTTANGAPAVPPRAPRAAQRQHGAGWRPSPRRTDWPAPLHPPPHPTGAKRPLQSLQARPQQRRRSRRPPLRRGAHRIPANGGRLSPARRQICAAVYAQAPCSSHAKAGPPAPGAALGNTIAHGHPGRRPAADGPPSPPQGKR